MIVPWEHGLATMVLAGREQVRMHFENVEIIGFRRLLSYVTPQALRL